MGFIIAPSETPEYKALVKLLFGSVEEMHKSPLLLKISHRIKYLHMLKMALNSYSVKQRNQIKWYNLVGKFQYWFFTSFILKSILKDVRSLMSRYMEVYALPVEFVVTSIDQQFAKLMVKVSPLTNVLDMEEFRQ